MPTDWIQNENLLASLNLREVRIHGDTRCNLLARDLLGGLTL